MEEDRLLRRINEYLRGKIQLRLETMSFPKIDLCQTPPEVGPDVFTDPIKYKVYRIFLAVKDSYKKPAALAIVYFFEFVHNFHILEMYAHDLVAAEFAWSQGFSGRDIDYVIVTNDSIPPNIVEKVSSYLDSVIGDAITNYFLKKGLWGCDKPYHEILQHNLVEIHVIRPEEKNKFGLSRSIHTIPVERLDVEKYRNRIKMMILALEKIG